MSVDRVSFTLGIGVWSKEVNVTLPHFQLPADLGDYLNKLMLTYHNLAKPSTSAEFLKKNKELGKRGIVGRGLAYLVQLNLMKRAGRGKYDLTATGQIIRKALVSGGNAQQPWQAELKKHKLFAMMQNYLKQVEGVGTAVGFGNWVRTAEGRNWARQFTEDGGRRICSLFASKGLINYDENTGNFSFKETALAPVQVVTDQPAAAERVLLHVSMDSTGNLNVRVSGDFNPGTSKRIVDMVLGEKSSLEKTRAQKK